MTSKLYWFSLSFMLVCNIFMFSRIINKDKKIRILEMRNLKDDLVIHENYILYESLDLSLENLMLYKGNNADYILINEVIETPKLVFRYNLNMCPPCIQSVIYSIKEVFPNYERNENIFFSCKGLENRLKSSYNGKVNYSFVDESLFFLIESYNVPYLYVIDKDLKMKFLFVVPKDNKQKIVDYLKIVKERCFI